MAGDYTIQPVGGGRGRTPLAGTKDELSTGRNNRLRVGSTTDDAMALNEPTHHGQDRYDKASLKRIPPKSGLTQRHANGGA